MTMVDNIDGRIWWLDFGSVSNIGTHSERH